MNIQTLAVCGRLVFRKGNIEIYSCFGHIYTVVWNGNKVERILNGGLEKLGVH